MTLQEIINTATTVGSDKAATPNEKQLAALVVALCDNIPPFSCRVCNLNLPTLFIYTVDDTALQAFVCDGCSDNGETDLILFHNHTLRKVVQAGQNATRSQVS